MINTARINCRTSLTRVVLSVVKCCCINADSRQKIVIDSDSVATDGSVLVRSSPTWKVVEVRGDSFSIYFVVQFFYFI